MLGRQLAISGQEAVRKSAREAKERELTKGMQENWRERSSFLRQDSHMGRVLSLSS